MKDATSLKIVGNRIVIRDKRMADAWDDYLWECDEELSYLDAASPRTISFYHYLMVYERELAEPPFTSLRFSVDTEEGKHIGNCCYYNISYSRNDAELGVMIGDRDYWDKGWGTDVVSTLVDYMFRHESFNRIYLKTLVTNYRAQRCFAKCGFTQYDRMQRDGFSFVLMQIFRRDWAARQAQQASENGASGQSNK